MSGRKQTNPGPPLPVAEIPLPPPAPPKKGQWYLRCDAPMVCGKHGAQEFADCPVCYDELASRLEGLEAGPRCHKCGSSDIRTRWHEHEWRTWVFDSRQCERHDVAGYEGEHLHRYCETCHFDWVDKVKEEER